MSDFNVFHSDDPSRARDRAGGAEKGDQLVLVPVPRSRLQDVYAVLGKRAPGPEGLRWEPMAWGFLRGSVWVAREVVGPTARELRRQDLAQVGQTLVEVVGRSARALFDPLDGEPDSP